MFIQLCTLKSITFQNWLSEVIEKNLLAFGYLSNQGKIGFLYKLIHYTFLYDDN